MRKRGSAEGMTQRSAPVRTTGANPRRTVDDMASPITVPDSPPRGARRWPSVLLIAAVCSIAVMTRAPLVGVAFLFVAVVPFEKLFPRHRQQDLIRAVQTLAAGDSVLDPAVTGRIMSRSPGAATGPIPSSPRSSNGLSNAEIAGELGVGEATAKTHVSRVLTKLGVRDRVQAVIYAYESGFAPNKRSRRSAR